MSAPRSRKSSLRLSQSDDEDMKKIRLSSFSDKKDDLKTALDSIPETLGVLEVRGRLHID